MSEIISVKDQVQAQDNESRELKYYNISAKNKNSTYTIEHYVNTICEKEVTLMITTVWRWGEFGITIFEDEKEKIENMDPLNLNDNGGEFISTTNGWQDEIEIKDVDTYNEEELKSIYESIYEDIDNKVLHDTSVLEDENGWVLNDTIYEIHDGVELEEDE